VELYAILKVKNAMVKSVNRVTKYAVCSLPPSPPVLFKGVVWYIQGEHKMFP